MTIFKAPYPKALRRFTMKGKQPKTKICQGKTKIIR